MWGASALIVFGQRAERAVLSMACADLRRAPISPGWVSAGRATCCATAIAFATVVPVTAVVYYLGPQPKLTFRMVLPGAALATFLWLIATMGFAWYVRHLVNYNVLYGGVGAGLALLVWMYVLAVISLYGCEFNAARERAARTASTTGLRRAATIGYMSGRSAAW